MSFRLLITSVIACGCAVCTYGTTHAETPTQPSALSEATEKLASQNYSEREKAVRSIDHLLAANAMSLLQTDDDEALAKACESLQFNRRLSAWLLAVSKLPLEQKEKQLALLDRPEMATILPALFSGETATRSEGVRKFAHAEDDIADPLLLFFLNDDAASVAVASLEVMWDRPASPAIVEELWLRGVKMPLDLAFETPKIEPAETVTFKGQPFAVETMGFSSFPQLHGADQMKSRLARDVLGHLKGPGLAKHVCTELTAVIARIKAGAASPQVSVRRLREPLSALAGLAADADVKAAVPSLVQLMNLPLTKMKDQVILNMQQKAMSYYSIRTEALAALARLTGQKVIEYGLHSEETNNGWLSESRETEQQAVDRMNAWCKEHAAEFAVAQ